MTEKKISVAAAKTDEKKISTSAVKAATVPEKATTNETAAETAKEMKKTTAKKAPAAKKTAESKTSEKKTTVKKTAARKTAVKKAAAHKEPAASLILQFGGKEIAADSLFARIKEIWTGAGNREEDIKDMKLYVKPEENTAYYVINEETTGSFEL